MAIQAALKFWKEFSVQDLQVDLATLAVNVLTEDIFLRRPIGYYKHTLALTPLWPSSYLHLSPLLFLPLSGPFFHLLPFSLVLS